MVPPPDAPDAPRGGDLPDWEARVARAEINGRRVNEAIQRGAGGADPVTFLCECGHIGCNDKLLLTQDAYERARSSFERFVIVPGHEIPQVDTVVETHGDHLVVAKHGPAAALAERADPRRDGDD